MSDTCPQCGSPSKRGTNRPIDAPSLICSDPWHGVLPVEPQPAKDKQQCEACGTFCEVRVGLSLRGPMVCGFCFDRRAELRAKFTLDGKPLENATFEIPPAVETVPPEDVAGILKGVEEMNAGQTKSITEIRKELSALGVPPYAKGGGDFIDSMEALCKFLVEHGIENIDDLRQRLRPVAGVVPQGAEPINSRQLLNRWKNGSISQQKAYRSIVGAGLVKQCCNFAESFALAHAAASQAAGASSMSAEQFAATWEAPMRRDHSRYASALAEAYAAELKAKIAELQHEIIELRKNNATQVR